MGAHFSQLANSMRFIFTLIFTIFSLSLSFADNTRQQGALHINKAEGRIVVDGQLDESDWQLAEVATNFWQKFPFDTSRALMNTEVRMTYDRQNIYISAVCYFRPDQRRYQAVSMRRDFNLGQNDYFNVYIDPFQDQTNGFSFGVTPIGVQREGLIANGGDRGTDTDWDNRWNVETKIYEDRWVAEMAIPFKTIRYEEGSSQWNINFVRRDYVTNEEAVWSWVPRNFRSSSLAYTGLLVWDEPLPSPGANIAIIPYVAGGVQRDRLVENTTKGTFNFGADAKVAVTPSLNLDLTVNPDFSQVEVDQQVTNLSRFEIFFPERRQFFLENSDLFAQFGFSRIRPFFSRRIGIAQDPETGGVVQNPIYYGARLSGKVGHDWRVGLLNMQTASNEAINLPSHNYTVAAVQRQVFSRSNIAGIFVNKQEFSLTGEDGLQMGRYNRVAGLDYNLASKDNRWTGKFFYHRTFIPNNLADQKAHASYLGYHTPNLNFGWNHEYVGENYTAEVGFVPRRGYWRFEPNARYTVFPKSPRISRVLHHYSFGLYTDFYFDKSYRSTDRAFDSYVSFNFQNTSRFNFGLRRQYIYLFSSFDPTNTRSERLAAGTDYTYHNFHANYYSDSRRTLYYRVYTNLGQYFNGKRNSVNGSISYRMQPYGEVSLDGSANFIRLPSPYASANLYLIGPRLDFSFTKSLFLSTIVQYNNQINNVNIYSRLQWRFKPVSDFYLVYTDNYFPESFTNKSRALVFKVSYWFNV